jgi:hypothetical protein
VPGTGTQPGLAAIRWFDSGGAKWGAWLAGEGVAGTGRFARPAIGIVRFCRAEDPDRAVREAIIVRGRFDQLYESELRALLETATPVPATEPREPSLMRRDTTSRSEG